jgi:hypothetical protein
VPFHEVCRILVREPFNLRPWEIERLSWYQIHHIYLCPTDEHGKPISSWQPSNISREEAEQIAFKAKGLTDAAIADIRQQRRQLKQEKK